MFMMPIPPTSREMPAMAPRNMTKVVGGLLEGFQGVLLVVDREVVLPREAVAETEEGRNFSFGPVHQGLVPYLDVNQIDGHVAPEWYARKRGGSRRW